MQDYDVELVVEEARKSGFAEGYDVGHQAGYVEGYEAACAADWSRVSPRHLSRTGRLRGALDRAADWFARALDFGMQEWR